MAESLHILQISTADIAGGAERVALDLHRKYLAAGHNATLAVGWKFRNNPNVIQIPNEEYRSHWTQFWNSLAPQIKNANTPLPHHKLRFRRLLKSIGNPIRAYNLSQGHDDFDFPGTRWLIEHAQHFDIVHLHNLHDGYFDLRLLPELCMVAPVVVTAHDIWLATGHCAQSVDCSRWREGCGSCPHLTFPPAIRKDNTHANWLEKQSIYHRCRASDQVSHSTPRLTLTSPSQWGIDTLNESILASAASRMLTIPNGVESAVFFPRDRDAIRAELGIPHEAQVIAFSAADRSNPYKDIETLSRALSYIADTKPLIHFIAIGNARDLSLSDQVSLHAPGYLFEPAEIARYLSASDVFIHAARADTFPLAILEAQACGIPVIATDVGGISETFVEGRTGILVPPMDADALIHACLELLADDERRNAMKKAAIQHATKNFSLQRMMERYIDLYRSLT